MTNLYDSFGAGQMRSDSPADNSNGRLSSNSGGSMSSTALSSNGDSADSLRSPSRSTGITRALPAITRTSATSNKKPYLTTNNARPEAQTVVINDDPLVKSGGVTGKPTASSTSNNNAQKSPILIKYNYYDYNGTRQEQTNDSQQLAKYHNNNNNISLNNRIQRQLSPTFKQSLDLIVKNCQQLQMAAHQTSINATGHGHQLTEMIGNNKLAGRNQSESPEWSANHTSNNQASNLPLGPQLARRYKMSSYEQRCLRCQKTVYQMDKVGPLKDFTFYHQNCFKCRECGTKLTLKTYFNNQQLSHDQEVYCHRHCPKTGPAKLDNQSVGIRAALNAPKVFEQQQSNCQQAPHLASSNNYCDYSPINIQQQLNAQQQQQHQSAAMMVTQGNARPASGLHPDGQHCSPSLVGVGPPSVDSRALHIQHAVSQTKLQNLYKQQPHLNQRLSQFINMRLEYLEPKQKMLEMRHREEEDALFKAFEAKWRLEETSITEQIRSEWQSELEKLLDKYKRQLSSISASDAAKLVGASKSSLSANNNNNNQQQQQQQQLGANKMLKIMDNILNNTSQNGSNNNQAKITQSTSSKLNSKHTAILKQHQLANANSATMISAASATTNSTFDTIQSSASETPSSRDHQEEKKMIEYERMNLEATMTIKLDRKKETLKRKLKEFERQATAELVEKQSKEMLALISLKLGEFKEEQKRKIGSDLDQFEAIESLANQFECSFRMLADEHQQQQSADRSQNQKKQLNSHEKIALEKKQQHEKQSNHVARNHQSHSASSVGTNTKQPHLLAAFSEVPPPAPGPANALPKLELYNSERPEEAFGHIDQMAISVAREDQQTFTDLVHHLTRNCLNDVEKVRAIFRWITVKNLNTMDFDSSVKPDTPLGLLRGIKNGSESYHVLFKRLCSYAGLHCVVIKGYSKSAGYQPGLRFEGSRFRNSWNAVYVAGAWRFVQCNWGARHLVSVAVQDKYKEAANGSGGAKIGSPTSKSGQQSAAAPPASQSINKRQLPAVNMQHPSKGATGQAAIEQQVPNVFNGARPISSLAQSKSASQHHKQQVASSSYENAASAPQPNLGRRGLLVPASSSLLPGSGRGVASSPTHQEKQPKSMSVQNNNTSIPSGINSLVSDLSNATFSGGDLNYASPRNQYSCFNSPRLDSPTYVNQGHMAMPQNNKTTSAKSSNVAGCVPSPSDNLRYEYDDHYFLTDPDEFIHEFFPHASEWQLIRPRPISLSEFEQLPFVRSLFFRYGLYFPQAHIKSVLHADSSGATTIKIGMPTHLIPNLIFHYNLRYYHSEEEYFEGISLKRFVMQSIENGSNDSGGLLSNVVSFRVHLPESGAFILDIFANSITPNQYISGEPMRFKSVCKFKIVAKNLKTVMIPLPDCASGEFGPMKATRLFGIIPLTHEDSLITVKPNTADGLHHLEIQFRMTRPLVDFMATLHKNGYDERQLSRICKIFIEGDIITISIKFFEEGQYGLDIYTRDRLVVLDPPNGMQDADNTAGNCNNLPPTTIPKQKQLLTHCCKYLINVKAH